MNKKITLEETIWDRHYPNKKIKPKNEDKLKLEIIKEKETTSPKCLKHFKIFFWIYISLLILLILTPLTLIFGLFTPEINLGEILYEICIYSLSIPILLLPIVLFIYLYKYSKKNQLTKELKLIRIYLETQLILIFLSLIFRLDWLISISLIISIIIMYFLVKVINSNYPRTKWFKTKEGKLVLFLIILYVLISILNFVFVSWLASNITIA